MAPFSHIRSTCHNLYCLRSDIYLADHKFVRIRMFLNAFYLSDHNFIKILIHVLISFYLRAG